MVLSVSAAVLYGDANQDGDVNAADLTDLARHVAGIELLTGDGLTACCLSGSNNATASDLTKLARYTAHIIPDLIPDSTGDSLVVVDTDPAKNGNMVVNYNDLLS